MVKRKKPREAKTRFLNFVREHLIEECNPLPLIHITPAYRFAEIIPGDELIPVWCEIFQQELIYTFYGRPAYKSQDMVNSELEFNWPIVLLFDHANVGEIKRIMPFDSGAFNDRIYANYFHKDSQMLDFELPGDIGYATALASIFYTSPQRYMTANADRNPNIGLSHFEAQGVQALNQVPVFSRRTGERRDERSSTIEVQIGEKIKLIDNVMAIILPQQYVDHEEIMDAVARWHLPTKNIRYYDMVYLQDNSSVSGEIYRVVREIYRENGLVA
ncbi:MULTISPECIES: hypothetical protein [Rhizobium]|uniref:Uncharacterized protein n=1 Tax=Rhizobium phaseoli TaxID=396 RepID=A0A7X6F890_9HYPH|nr:MULTISPECIES: hypothetical protein [Rhizobium]MDE8763646.1 hypothetical protein [Rhizobium sp. CBK13]NKF14866.1 hypothetical protein [Rhizobium phaseoli]QPK09187.1 hypothetical protein HER27_000970 [Rhizobium phaseoli]